MENVSAIIQQVRHDQGRGRAAGTGMAGEALAEAKLGGANVARAQRTLRRSYFEASKELF